MILYFTGTGNSKYIAERIAENVGDTLFDVNTAIKNGNTREISSENGKLIFVTPTYAWRIPLIVCDWIKHTVFNGKNKVWFVMDCGGEIGNAAKYNIALCSEKDFIYMGTAQIVMPENYVAMFSVPSNNEAAEIIKAAEPVIDNCIETIENDGKFSVPRNNLYDKIMSSAVNDFFYPFFVKSDAFYADNKCVGCGKCVTLCPLNNIKLLDGKPKWGKNCTHCMACICYCPTEAIEYGKKSRNKPRYTCEKIIKRGN